MPWTLQCQECEAITKFTFFSPEKYWIINSDSWSQILLETTELFQKIHQNVGVEDSKLTLPIK